MAIRNILLVCPQRKEELSKVVVKNLEDTCSQNAQEVIVDEVWNEADARIRLQHRAYDLIITDVYIARDKHSPLVEEEQRGLALLEDLHQEKSLTPSILLSVTPQEDLYRRAMNLSKCRLVFEGKNFTDDLVNYTCEILKEVTYSSAKPTPEYAVRESDKKTGNVDISIDLDNKQILGQKTYIIGQYHIKGIGFYYEPPAGELILDFKTMMRLVERSKELEEETGWPKWEEELKEVGQELMTEIVDNNTKFLKKFRELVGKVDGIENTRIRFKVGKSSHAIPIEALYEEDEEQFLMIHSSIYRRLNVQMEVPPLFQGNGSQDAPINCLILEADTSGYVPDIRKGGRDLELPGLAQVSRECQQLESFFQTQQQTLPIGKICRIQRSPDRDFLELVKETLVEQGPWQLVHYAGHSIYDDEHKGYVIFPGKTTAQPVPMDTFSYYLRKSLPRFIYLSSCHSSAEDFVFTLANNKIPAVLGFRWAIEDKKALQYAAIFYRHLFAQKSLGEAFLAARQDMYNDDKKNRIWAAPLLVLQERDDD